MNIDINELRKAFSRGENIVHLLSIANPDLDRAEVIEAAYDIQSGSYTEFAIEYPDCMERYARDIYELSAPYVSENDLILDCGAGELTTLSLLSKYLPQQCHLLACDISLSRLRVGRRFAEKIMSTHLAKNLDLFVADMANLPLADNSIDVVFTSHALEPNHGREFQLLQELLRVSRKYLLLFEPSWEHSSKDQRARMELHGYVRDLPNHIQAAGGRLVSVSPLPNPLMMVNPTYCFVVAPSEKEEQPSSANKVFQCPRSGFRLQKLDNYWWSQEGGWAYPIIDGTTCLRQKHGLLMSHA